MVPAELPFDPEVDREALERRRAEDLRARRKFAAKRELEVAELEANPNPHRSPDRCVHARVPLSEPERDALDECARQLRISRVALLRRAGLALARQLRRRLP